jgi:nucleotide-binding universal stress UspA family protein
VTTIPATRQGTGNDSIHLGTTRLSFKRILFATDFSPLVSVAFKWAAQFSRYFSSRLYMVHVLSYGADSGVMAPVLVEVEIKRAQEKLSRYFLRKPDLVSIEHEEIVVRGPTTELIREVVTENNIDLVVMGSHGRGGIGKLILGSVAESALRHLHCPVLVCGSQCKRNYEIPKSIVLATDLSVRSLRPAQYASALAAEFDADLTIVHVISTSNECKSDDEEEQSREERLNELVPAIEELREKVQCKIESGDPASELLEVARSKRANLIVMGVDENGKLADHAPWATISKVIRGARCPVLAVQPHLV